MPRPVLMITTARPSPEKNMAARLKTVAATATVMPMTEAIVTSLATVAGTGTGMAMATMPIAMPPAIVLSPATTPQTGIVPATTAMPAAVAEVVAEAADHTVAEQRLRSGNGGVDSTAPKCLGEWPRRSGPRTPGQPLQLCETTRAFLLV